MLGSNQCNVSELDDRRDHVLVGEARDGCPALG